MKKLSELVPTEESLKFRADRKPMQRPTPEKLKVMDETLEHLGYRNTNEEVYNVIRSFGALMLAGTAYKGLFLKGECGIGKTFGVECLAHIFRMPVFRPTDFAAILKELDGNSLDLETYVITGGDFYEEPKNIVIDDLGCRDKTKTYGETVDIMSDVLEMRYRAFLKHGVLTIVTTNLSDEEIMRRYGNRIEDRLHEMFYIKRVSGKSLRSPF